MADGSRPVNGIGRAGRGTFRSSRGIQEVPGTEQKPADESTIVPSALPNGRSSVSQAFDPAVLDAVWAGEGRDASSILVDSYQVPAGESNPPTAPETPAGEGAAAPDTENTAEPVAAQPQLAPTGS
jgi:hypothetical protein